MKKILSGDESIQRAIMSLLDLHIPNLKYVTKGNSIIVFLGNERQGIVNITDAYNREVEILGSKLVNSWPTQVKTYKKLMKKVGVKTTPVKVTKPKVSKKEFTDNKQTTADKIEVNGLLKEFTKQTKKKTAVVLDGTHLNTSKMLRSIGFKDKNIHIPNPFEYDEIHNKKDSSVYNELLGDFIERAQARHLSFDMAFFDYMGSFDGNKTLNIFPKQDIHDYFSNNLPKNNSVLAITCSVRGNNKTSFKHEGYAKAVRFITSVANHYGFQALFQTHRIYGQMYFIVFKVFDKRAKADTFISMDDF